MTGNPEIRGVIFDLDDTLLDNRPDPTGRGMHEMSRLNALREVGRLRGIERFLTITPQENMEAFLTAKTSTMEGAVWNILEQAGLVDAEEIDRENEILREIVLLKDTLHREILREHGREVLGASAFVRKLAATGLSEKMAIASSANRAEIDIFLDIMGLSEFFPENRIVSKEKVTLHKPHPQAYELAFGALGLPDSARGQVLAFEDDPRGVQSAQGAGLFTCAITTRHTHEYFLAMTTKPDLIAESFAEFEEKLGLVGTSTLSERA